jgi:hypothetical protein
MNSGQVQWWWWWWWLAIATRAPFLERSGKETQFLVCYLPQAGDEHIPFHTLPRAKTEISP